MATIKFRIRSNANKNVSIKIYLSLGRKTYIETSTGFTINPQDWSTSTGKPKQSNAENKSITSSLNALETYIYDALNNDLTKETLIDAYWLQNQIKNCFSRVEKTDSGLLTNHIQYIIDNAQTRKVQGRNSIGISKSRIKGYERFKEIIEDYQKVIKKQINFLEINKTFVDKFTNWLLKTREYSINYSGKTINNLKTVCIDADLNNVPINPYYKQISGFTEKNEDRYIITLDFNELEKIRKTEITIPHLNNAKKWILIGCEIGQRAGDLLKITKDNIRYKGGNMYIDLIQEKTKKAVTIGIINPHIIELIENEFPTSISPQNLNNYIKTVCQLAKIDTHIKGRKIDQKTKRKKLDYYPKHELVTTHSFRRSFATNYYKYIPTPILMGITGHEKESTFLVYINQREDKDANADRFRVFYEKMNIDKKPVLKVVNSRE